MIATRGLTFDPKLHKYTLDGRTLTSVTSILSGLYTGPKASPERLAEAGKIGTAIHHATAKDEGGGVIHAGDQFAGSRAAFRAWKRARRFMTQFTEVQMASRAWAVSGTCDRIGTFTRPDPVPDWWRWPETVAGIVDLKTGRIPSTCAAQLAAYRALAVEHRLVVPRCPIVAVGVDEAGCWRDKWYVGPGPDLYWIAAWSIHHVRPDGFEDA